MADNKNADKRELEQNPEISFQEGGLGNIQEAPEVKERPSHDSKVAEELRREIEMMELDDSLKNEAKKKAQKIEFLGEKEKIEHLLEMAREHGLVFAINVARKMNDPYILDTLHDTLSQEGYFKDFVPGNKPSDDNIK